jgi:hypothetical protein
MRLRILIFLMIGIWAASIAGILIYNQWNKWEHIKVSPDPLPIFSKKEMEESGPDVGGSIVNEETPSQLVARYLQYINGGLYDEAASIIEPNILMEYTTKRRDLSVHDALISYVRLFPKGGAKTIRVGKGSFVSVDASVDANVELTTGENIVLTFSLHIYNENEHGDSSKYWLVVEQQKN